jgi:hypothetical protein
MKAHAMALVIVSVVTYHVAAHAAVFSGDLSSQGDGLITRDDETGLDWLDLTQTTGVSYDYIRNDGGGWRSQGWRHATAAEVCDLMAKLAPAPAPCPGSRNDLVAGQVSAYVGLLGQTLDHPNFLCAALGGPIDGTLGLFDDQNATAGVGYGGVSYGDNCGGQQASAFVSLNEFAASGSSIFVGHFLVRVTPPPPPCNDGIDNDGDGLTDFPNDLQCVDLNGAEEPSSASFRKVADTFTQKPGTTTNFANCGYTGCWFGPPAIDAGAVAFADSDSGATGIYAGIGEGLLRVADESTIVPGVPTATFNWFGQPDIDESTVAFWAANNGVFSTFGVFQWSPGAGADWIARHGTPVPGQTFNFSVNEFSYISIDDGVFAFQGGNAPFVSPSYYGVFSNLMGPLSALADVTTQIPGGTGNFAFFPGSGANPADYPDAAGQKVAFSGRGSGGQEGIYVADGASVVRLLDKSTPLQNSPDSIVGIGPFAFDGTQAISAVQVAVPYRGALLKTIAGQTTKLFGTESLIPGTSTTFGQFSGFATDSGHVAISGGPSAYQVIVSDFMGAWTVVIDTDMTLDGKDLVDVKIGRHGISENQIAFVARFAGGSSGVYVATLASQCANGVDDDGDGLDDLADPGCTNGGDLDEQDPDLHDPSVPCNDGVDNDDDGLVDFSDDPGCVNSQGTIENPECDDGIDNDGDARTDAVSDIQCVASWDPDEGVPGAVLNLDAQIHGDPVEPLRARLASGAYKSTLVTPIRSGALFTAWRTTNSGCNWRTHYGAYTDSSVFNGGLDSSACSPEEAFGLVSDPQIVLHVATEQDVQFFVRDNHLSDNADGVSIQIERAAECEDEIDNDGDGLVDDPADPGCLDPASNLENPKCDDDLDNDGDGKIDWDGGAGMGMPDPECAVAYRNRETPNRSGGCGLGAELLLVMPLLSLSASRRRRASKSKPAPA